MSNKYTNSRNNHRKGHENSVIQPVNEIMDENMNNQSDENRPNMSTEDKRLNRLEALSENLSNGLNQLTEDVKVLFQVMREGHKTNWGVMATWAGVLLMLLVAMGNGYIGQPLENLKNQTNKLSENFSIHISDGHPKTVIKQVENNTKAIILLDITLQREMRLLDDAMKQDLEALRRTEQADMFRIEAEVLRLRNWRSETNNLITTITTLEDKINHLQNKMDLMEVSLSMGYDGAHKTN